MCYISTACNSFEVFILLLFLCNTGIVHITRSPQQCNHLPEPTSNWEWKNKSETKYLGLQRSKAGYFMLPENFENKTSLILPEYFNETKQAPDNFCHIFSTESILSVICSIPILQLKKLRIKLLWRFSGIFETHSLLASILWQLHENYFSLYGERAENHEFKAYIFVNIF